jgi:ribosome maturation factor RimP
MIESAAIREMVNGFLEGTGLFLVDVRIKSANTIMVFVDGDREVSIADCARISRFIESHLNRDQEDYELRVSSAGIDHPFVNLRQYVKNINRMVQVTLIDGTAVTGRLTAADEHRIEMVPQGKKTAKKKPVELPVQQIAMNQIKETKGIITFN